MKVPFNRKKMSEKKDYMEDHIENEEISSVRSDETGDENLDDADNKDSESVTDEDKTILELAEMKDKFLRLYSEFDNYRKRTQKERLDLFKTAASDVITSLLPVLDDFERAMKFKSAEKGEGESSLGTELIYNKLKNTLEQKGLKRMNSIGELFSDEFHEAIANVPAPDESMKGKVMDESECGYFLNDKVIRHAKVIVGN